MVKQLLFQLARAPFMGAVVGKAFQRYSWLIPVKKVYQSRDVLAFFHPRPSHANHLILSPRRPVRNLQQLSGDELVKLWQAARDIRRSHPAFADAYTLLANGGKRQDVQQVHFHMFPHPKSVNDYEGREPVGHVLHRDDCVCVFQHPNPNWALHFLVLPVGTVRPEAYFEGVLRSIDALNASYPLVQEGYALVYQYSAGEPDAALPVFHIICGQKRS